MKSRHRISTGSQNGQRFSTHYAGSLPCMPARREWLAGVQEFLWRPWGPMKPSDDPLPRLARQNDVLTQLITDHFHYFQHGSHGFYEDFNGFEFVRGHEFDAWQTAPKNPDPDFLDRILDADLDPPSSLKYLNRAAYARNVADFTDESDFFAPKVFSRTVEWLSQNQAWDQWFCFVDSFDVHEPFHVPEPYTSMYVPDDVTVDEPVWPYYGPVNKGQSALSDEELEYLRAQFAGNVTMVDEWFGRVLNTLDEEGLWDDTVVIVTSDHGFCLGDHGWIGKNDPPVYDVLARTPLFVWHPGAPTMGERISGLTSAIDLNATIRSLLGLENDDSNHSQSLCPLLQGETSTHRDVAIYGYWGSSINITDGQYTYLHPCDTDEPTEWHSSHHLDPHSWFIPTRPLTDADAGQFLPFTDAQVWRDEGRSFVQNEEPLLFDVSVDPQQQSSISNPQIKQRMRTRLVAELERLGAPASQYERLNLSKDSP